MNRIKLSLIAIFLICIGLLGFAMYLQIALDMLPCPLCVLQRYAFALIAIMCLLAFFMPKQHRFLMASGSVFSLAGIGFSGYQLWVISQPHGSCGVDPLTAPLNNFFVAKLFPSLFQANGMCDTPYDPILGLSIPAWAFTWFAIFFFASWILYFSQKKERVFFGKIRR